MPQVINTNVASLNSQRNLNSSQNALSTSLQRLSSGLRINSAKDDAAGLAISERMTSQIRGLNQAARNANDGISLAQTAEGALGEIGNNLQRIRELAVQSSNATNSASDRAAMQAEVAQLTSEITRVAGQTQFNGLNLLDGSFASQNFQIGANANQTISVSQIGDARASALGSNVLSTGGSHMGQAITAGTAVPTGAAAVVATDNFTLTTAQGGTTAAIIYDVSAGANGIAAAINSAGTDVGLSAVATNSATLGKLASAGTVSLTLNDQAISANVASTGDLSALAAAINGVAGTTGVSASFANPSNLSEITLSTTDGRDIRILDFNNSGTTKTIDVKGINGVAVELTGGADDSTRVVGNVDVYSSKGAITAAAANAEAFVSATATSSFSAVSSVSVASATGAQSAIRVLDEALQQINSSRGDLGALQNRFSSVITNLQTTSENLSASRSRIQDADFAAETAALTRAQIMQQAGVAMLAQANSLPNNVLSLLR
ncbi:flagellin N-terminal helical domain-containing protein [Nitrosomonas eutropha]|uniref:Flagellin n=2 Tax=Nitrosomonas eutropha TaxID=916 RepID=A0ABX5M426_9PROT|nr:flagellin [Nitrosomonas eutropha]ABI60057.1 flagellin domain protein [Nitrosomonas eutropha C91]PXV72944.1 flagellin [Nitrosomonas eutropha]